jgi:EAL domain-containing protein (putative c-di-GMP-specific phosphodiesterase class I)/DNA-binding response OmpR family regulator
VSENQQRLKNEKLVLLVEDDEVLLKNLAYFFLSAGFRVIEARDGLYALDEIRKIRPDLIVTDISMPRMDGLTFIRHAKFHLPDTPIVISSAFDDAGNYRQALRMGVSDFFAKPWDISELLNRSIELAEAATPVMAEASKTFQSALRACVELTSCEHTDAVIAVSIPDAFAAADGFMEWARECLESHAPSGSVVQLCQEKEILALINGLGISSANQTQDRIQSIVDQLRASIADFVGQPVGLLQVFAVTGNAVREYVQDYGVNETIRVVSALNGSDRAKPPAFRKIYTDLELAKQAFDIPPLLSGVLRDSPEQLSIYWQPKIRLSDGVMVGAEALARWESSPGSFVRPDVFVRAAKDWGFLRALNQVLRDRAMESAQAILDLLPSGERLSLNVEPMEVLEGIALEDLPKQVMDNNLSPDSFMLEITETESIPSASQAQFVDQLNQLAALGFGISIDDFGQGASAIQQIIDWPVSELKIDRSMTMRADSADVQAAFRASAGLAVALGVPVVAEGIENEEQVALMLELGVHVGQGFFWSQAVPAEELCRWHNSFAKKD